MTRTDIHAPGHSDFDPEAYRLIDVYDLHWQSEDHAPLHDAIEQLTKQAIAQAPHSNGCGHCGQTGLRYVALLVREDVSEWIFVGQDCLASRFTAMTKAKFAELKRNAELARKKQAVKTSWLALCAENPAMAYATYGDNIQIGLEREARALFGGKHGEDDIFFAGLGWGFGVMHDIARKARLYGSASKAQIALIERILGEQETKWGAYLAREAEKAANPAGPAPVGRQTVEGVVLSLKLVDTDFGSTTKMTVKLDNGSRVYGTVPASIWQVEKGDRIAFTASCEASDDADFAFFKRPTKASIITASVMAA